MDNYDIKKEVSDQYSLRGRVFHKLRDDILSGRYKGGEELREVAVGEEMGVSRTPVREAFRQLELEGLINIVPNKGAYVNGITARDVHDIYMIRAHLEGLCAKWAVDNITDEQMEEMEENIFLAEFHASKKHFEQMTELDNRFHELMYESCGSKLLEHALLMYHQYVRRIRSRTLSTRERSLVAISEHRGIMEALKARDSALAEKRAGNHMISAYKNMVDNGYISHYDD